MTDELLSIVAIALILVSAYALIETRRELNKNCKTWKVIAKGRIISKNRFYPALGYFAAIIGTILAIELVLGFKFNMFDLVPVIVLLVLGAVSTYNYFHCAIAKEGLIIGRWFKICVSWDRFGKVEIDGSIVRTKRHVLRVDEGLKRLSGELKL